MECYVEHHLLRSATIPPKLIKKKERKRDAKEQRKKFACQIFRIENKDIKFKLEEVAKMLSDKGTNTITKSERRRLVDVAEIVYDQFMAPEPIYENLAAILQSSMEASKVRFLAMRERDHQNNRKP